MLLLWLAVATGAAAGNTGGLAYLPGGNKVGAGTLALLSLTGLSLPPAVDATWKGKFSCGRGKCGKQGKGGAVWSTRATRENLITALRDAMASHLGNAHGVPWQEAVEEANEFISDDAGDFLGDVGGGFSDSPERRVERAWARRPRRRPGAEPQQQRVGSRAPVSPGGGGGRDSKGGGNKLQRGSVGGGSRGAERG